MIPPKKRLIDAEIMGSQWRTHVDPGSRGISDACDFRYNFKTENQENRKIRLSAMLRETLKWPIQEIGMSGNRDFPSETRCPPYDTPWVVL